MSLPFIRAAHRGGILSACIMGLMVFTQTHAHAQAPAALKVLGLDVHKTMGGRDVRIHTDGSPNYTVFRLTQPMRVVLDVAGGDVSAIRGPLNVEDGIIGHIAVRQYNADTSPIGRIIISFDDEAGYDVRTEGSDIVLHAQRPTEQPDAVAEQKQTLSDDGQKKAQPQTASSASDEAVAAKQPKPEPPKDAQDAVAPQRPAQTAPEPPLTPDAPRSKKPSKLGRIEHHDEGVLLRLHPVPTFTTTVLNNPPRLVLDLHDTEKRAGALRVPKKTAWAHRVRMAQHPSGLRVVFDLHDATQATVARGAKGLWVRPSKTPTPSVQEPKTAATKPPSAMAPAGMAPSTTALQNVTFDNVVDNDRVLSRLLLQTSGGSEPKVDVSNEHAWVLELADTTLPPRLERAIDTSAYPGAVTLVSTFAAQRKPPKVHVVVNLAEAASQTLTRVPTGWMWQIETMQKAFKAQSAAPRVAAFVAEAPLLDGEGGAPTKSADSARTGSAMVQRSPHRGSTKRISVDVKDADIINVLRLISEETGDNIIASDEVKGKVSLKLRNVPADQALDTMLRTKGFDKVRHNNILRVASAEAIQKEREQDLAKRKALAEVEDTFIKMVTINYATAHEVVDQLKTLLSPRGSVQVDSRTNTLILQDIASNIDRLVELARRLDKQTPLVNIQARIVEAQSTYLRDLGVQWGGTTQNTSRTGNPTGVYFPGDVTVNGAADAGITNQAAGLPTPARYAVNLPAALAGQGGGLGFILGSAGGSHLLDLRLTAMETNGTGKVISSPEVSTLDNKTARVSQGVEIPVSVVSAAGTNVRFVPAVLELEVTPHVTNDGTVLLRIKVQKSQLDYTQKSAAGDPSIQKKQAETEVLVRDGDTSVIGGIYTRTTSDSYSEVPFFARIPLLGRLFREHRGEDNRSELLVFITPRIINRDESVVQTGSVLQGSKALR